VGLKKKIIIIIIIIISLYLICRHNYTVITYNKLSCRTRMVELRHGPCVTRRSHSFYLPPTHKLFLFCTPSHRASSPFGWYSLCLPTKGWPSWVDLGGWLDTRINVSHRELNPDMFTYLSTNRAQCWLRNYVDRRQCANHYAAAVMTRHTVVHYFLTPDHFACIICVCRYNS